MRNRFLMLSLLALLTLSLTGCGADAQQLLDELSTTMADLKPHAIVDPSLIQSIGTWEAMVLWVGLGLYCLFRLFWGAIGSKLRGEKVWESIKRKHWVWLAYMEAAISPMFALVALSNIAYRLWDAVGLNLDTARRALGLVVPLLEQGHTSIPARDSLIPAVTSLSAFVGIHLGYQILLIIGLPVAITLMILFNNSGYLKSWGIAAVCWIFLGISEGIGLQCVAHQGGVGKALLFLIGTNHLAVQVLTWGNIGLFSFLPLVSLGWTLWPWKGEDESAVSTPTESAGGDSRSDSALNLAQTAALLWTLINQHRRGGNPTDDIIYGNPPRYGQLPAPGETSGNGPIPGTGDDDIAEGEFDEIEPNPPDGGGSGNGKLPLAGQAKGNETARLIRERHFAFEQALQQGRVLPTTEEPMGRALRATQDVYWDDGQQDRLILRKGEVVWPLDSDHEDGEEIATIESPRHRGVIDGVFLPQQAEWDNSLTLENVRAQAVTGDLLPATADDQAGSDSQTSVVNRAARTIRANDGTVLARAGEIIWLESSDDGPVLNNHVLEEGNYTTHVVESGHLPQTGGST